MMRSRVKDVTTLVVLAALYIVVSILPGMPVIGVPMATIDPAAILGPIYGLCFGPFVGGLGAFLGALLAWMMPPGTPQPFGLLTTICPAGAAFAAGALTRRRVGGAIPGWMLSATAVGLPILGWYATWVGVGAPFYPLIHLIGLGIVLALRGHLTSWFESGSKARLTLFAALASYVGIVTDHMLGNLAFIVSIDLFIPLQTVQTYFLKPLGLPDVPSMFMYMMPVSVVERSIMTIAATVIGVGLLTALRSTGLIPLPPGAAPRPSPVVSPSSPLDAGNQQVQPAPAVRDGEQG